MKENMKKLSLLIYHESASVLLKDMQSLGVVHIETDKANTNDKIQSLHSKLARYYKNAKILSDLEKERKLKLKPVISGLNIEALLFKIESLTKEIDSLKVPKDLLKKEIEYLSVWGEFDPDLISQLSEAGINVKFYSCIRTKFLKLNETEAGIQEIGDRKGVVYFVAYAKGEVKLSDASISEERFNLKKISLLKEELFRLETKSENLLKEMESICANREEINVQILKLEDSMSYEVAKVNLAHEAEGSIYFVRAWIPAKKQKEIIAFLSSKDVYYLIENPSENDNVPIKLKNGPFARLFEPITKMYCLPVYVEIDPTPFLAPFFAIFFGLCMADVGYGTIMLIATLLALFLVKDKKKKPVIYLGMVLSIMTIICGFVLNSFFGSEVLKLPISDSLKKGVIFSDINAAMAFAIMLGVLQVVVGYMMQTVNKIRTNGFTGGLQPLGTILFVLGAVFLGVFKSLPEGYSIGPIPVKALVASIPATELVCESMIISGLVLVLFFNNLKLKIFIRPLTGLWELYGMLTGIPGDILSYMRLFALGLAGGLLGNAFNQLAFMVRGEPATITGTIGMVLILVLGHSMNLALAALGAFVHPLRLTLLEFYKSVGFTGGGLEYNPLSYKSTIKGK